MLRDILGELLDALCRSTVKPEPAAETHYKQTRHAFHDGTPISVNTIQAPSA